MAEGSEGSKAPRRQSPRRGEPKDAREGKSSPSREDKAPERGQEEAPRASFIKKVEYKQIAEQLSANNNQPRPRHPDEDKALKIANTNFGMLEKSTNRNQKNYLFDSYSQCQHYQSRHGGAIHYLSRHKEVKTAGTEYISAPLPFPSRLLLPFAVSTSGENNMI